MVKGRGGGRGENSERKGEGKGGRRKDGRQPKG